MNYAGARLEEGRPIRRKVTFVVSTREVMMALKRNGKSLEPIRRNY